MFVAIQFSLVKANYASEVASKKCSNSIVDRVIYQDAMSGNVEAQFFLGNKLFAPSCTSDEQERGLIFLMHAAQGDYPNALFILGYMIFENAQNYKEFHDALRYLAKVHSLAITQLNPI